MLPKIELYRDLRLHCKPYGENILKLWVGLFILRILSEAFKVRLVTSDRDAFFHGGAAKIGFFARYVGRYTRWVQMSCFRNTNF